MKRKILLITGAILILGAALAAIALAQNMSDKTKDAENHECTPEMIASIGKNGSETINMTQYCNSGMMDSTTCTNMTDTAMAGCSSMMDNLSENKTAAHMADPNHCGSGAGSMM